MKNKIIKTLTILTLLTCQKISASKEHVFFLCDQLHNGEMRTRLGITPLHCVQTFEEAHDLVKSGCDINARDNDLLTPIQYMMYHNRQEIAVYLRLCAGANCSKEDHARVDALLRNKKGIRKDIYDFVDNNFIDKTVSYMENHDKVDSQLFFPSSAITYKILKDLKNKLKSPTSIVSRYTPSPNIEIPSPRK